MVLRALESRGEPEERQLVRRNLCGLLLRLELAEMLIEKKGLASDWKGSWR